jgi:hypothetical protein
MALQIITNKPEQEKKNILDWPDTHDHFRNKIQGSKDLPKVARASNHY